jgi:hypothetical protein
VDGQNAKGLGRLRSFVRKEIFGPSYLSYNFVPITFIDNNDPPRLTGESGGHFTKGGSPISYPSTYSKIGWSNMVYRASTLHIVVGRGWAVKELSMGKKVGPNLVSMLWSEDKDSVKLALKLLGLL